MLKMPVINPIETSICTSLQDEGMGSLYERVVLSRWFGELARHHGYQSVLEYSCSITKGYDNVAIIEQGIPVTIADNQIDRIRQGWKFAQRPTFSTLEDAPAADLVWNFAQVQMDPRLLDTMKARSKKHVLVLVPNVLNPGTPIHLAYHLLTRTSCRHAERGSVRIRTRSGLLQLLASRNIEVLTSGFIDVPPIPDIAFSIRELKEAIGLSKANGQNGNGHTSNGHTIADPTAVWKRIQQMTRFENSRLVAPLKPFFGHHIFALGRIA
jgi:hypothetical protein